MKIKDIQFEVRSFRFEEPMKVAFATIVDMETCIVRMTTDEGITGFGEAAPFLMSRVTTLRPLYPWEMILKKNS